jgi:glycine hydroxymethyltransferase
LAQKIDKSVFPGFQGGPIMSAVAAKAVCFGEALQPSFKKYAEQILKNAKAMEQVFRKEEVRMLTGGTSNHLILADVFSSLGISGGEAERVLDEVGITVNKNMIADDMRKPMNPSGIRFGTPALTTRGFTEQDSADVARLMIRALRARNDEKEKTTISGEVRMLAERHPIPAIFLDARDKIR